MKIDPVGKGLNFTIVLSIWAVLSTLTIVLRIWARYTIKGFGLDDYLMISAWMVFVCVITFDFLSINYGIGAHSYRLTPDDVKNAKKWFLFAGIAYAIATALVKVSICVLLMRVTRGTKRIYAIILYSVIILACAGSLTRVIAYATRCKPFSGAWDPTGTCRSPYILSDVTWFFSAVCITTDWICATLPIFIIWDLSLPLRTKIQIGFVLALGMIASVATIIRMKHLIDYTRTTDSLYSLMDVGLWSETEACLGIIAGSLPTMRPLLRYIPCIKSKNRNSAGFVDSSSYRFDSLSPRRVPAQGSSSSTSNPKNRVDGQETYMGHSFHITSGRDLGMGIERVRDVDLERGDDETTSEKGILSELRMDIVKETQFEVKSESSRSRSGSPMGRMEGRSATGDIAEQRVSRAEEVMVASAF